MRKVIKDFETNNKAVLVNLLVKVKNTAVKNFYSVAFKELSMILAHQVFTLLCKLRRYLNEDVFDFTIDI